MNGSSVGEDDGPVWKALADPTRRALLDRMRDGPRTTGALAAGFPVTRFAVMKHLDLLVEAGLVLVERRGRERLNFLNPVPLRRAYERWMAPYAAGAMTRTGGTMEQTGESTGTVDVRREVLISAPRPAVFTSVLDMGAWWPGRAREDSYVALEPHVGGRFYESWDRGGTLFGMVVGIADEEELRVSAASGSAVAGTWSLHLADTDGGGTVVTLHHRMVGAQGSAPAEQDTAWAAVLDALRAHVLARTG